MGGNFNPLDPVSQATKAVSGGGKGGNPPPAPNYGGAAQQQQASQFVNQYTPYGSQTFSQDPSSPSGFRSNINLDPQAQGALNSQLALSSGLGNLAQGQLGNVEQQYSKPMDMSSVQGVADKAYGAMTSRLDPQWQTRQTQQETQLTNQGLRPGDEAWDNAMRDFNNARNDAYQQANLGAIQTMPQTYQLALSQYEQPLNQLNAIRSGAQVQNPQFQQFGQAPYLGAAQAQGQYAGDVYNAQVGQQNAMMSGLFGLGSAGVGAYGAMNAAPLIALGSDRRLKSNIKRIGTHPELGIGIYEYDIFGKHDYGVMADEVEKIKPEAVTRHPKYGYQMVYYRML